MLGEFGCLVCMVQMLTWLHHSLVCITISVVHHMVLGKAASAWNTHLHASLLTYHFADKLSC